MKRPVLSAPITVAALALLSLAGCGGSPADAEAAPGVGTNLFYFLWWCVGVGGAVLSLWQAWQFFTWMESQPAGTP
ncbi:MAG: hypothetical protein ACKO40_04655, partial [Planctomycetaceae bacterium]